MSADSDKSNTLRRLRVPPTAARNEVAVFNEGVGQIRIAAPPVKGRANKELLAFLSQALGVGKSSLNIVRGHTSRSKAISVAGLSQKEVRQRLSPTP